ncbi:hypothetical protein G5I_12560 [Acromyrmex echinatior]|uniref:Uncharacterized protein n=1 Tax=Acromyrmex echinatior TaxID=103372 RepID=F4X2N0_ACREC|nr:hypothetical protein G5I_12560 [Acromyrmex echinatior]
MEREIGDDRDRRKDDDASTFLEFSSQNDLRNISLSDLYEISCTTNDVCCTNLRNLPEHQLPEEEVEEEEGVYGSRRVLGRETKGSGSMLESRNRKNLAAVTERKPTKQRFVLINGSKQRRKTKWTEFSENYLYTCMYFKHHCSSFIAIEAKGERRNVLEAPLSYDQDPLTQGSESNFRLISTGSSAETFPLPIGSNCLAAGYLDFIDYQAVTRKCKFQIAFIRPAGNAPRRKDATMEIIQFPTNWDVLQMKLKYSSLYLTSTLKRTQIQSRNERRLDYAFKSEIDGFLTNKINRKSNFPMSFKRGNAFSDYLILIELTFKSITEVFKYRSYIQGLITENLDIMTSKKLQRKVYIKSSSEDRQADAEEKYNSFRKFTELRKRIAQNSVYTQIDF